MALTDGEERVLADAPSGDGVSLEDLPDSERVVHADVIRRLCVGPEAAHVDPRGIRVRKARIAGVLDLQYCAVQHPLGLYESTFDEAPTLARCRIKAVDLVGCELPGCEASSIDVAATFSLEGSRIAGPVRLLGARIGADLLCLGTTFTVEGRDALVASLADVAANVTLVGAVANGQVRLVSMKIGGTLDCSDASIEVDPGTGIALAADRIETRNAVVLSRLRCCGEVRFIGAQIGSDLDCARLVALNEGRDALSVDGSRIGGNLDLSGARDVVGTVRLVGTTIDAALVFSGGTFRNPGTTALALAGASMGTLALENATVDGGVHLIGATTSLLADDLGKDASWGGASPIALEGFSYRFGGSGTWNRKLRFEWLKRSETFEPSAWKQLEEVYRNDGREGDAIKTAIARENDRLVRGALPFYRKVGRALLWLFLGHGYRPWLAGIWALVVIAAFALVVWKAPESFVAAEGVDASAPQPVVYAADTFVPIIDFGEAENWSPKGDVRWIEWTTIALGWALTSLFVAGFTRAVRT